MIYSFVCDRFSLVIPFYTIGMDNNIYINTVMLLTIVVRDSIVTGSGEGRTCSGKIPSPTRARVHHFY